MTAICVNCQHFEEHVLFINPIMQPSRSGYSAGCNATASNAIDPVFGTPARIGIVECRARNKDGECALFKLK